MNLDTNYTVDLEIFSNESPIECYKLRIVSINCIVLFLLSVVFNSFLLIIFLTKKQLQKSSNIFIFTLTLFNLIGSITEFPFVIVSNLYCKWIFSRMSCIFSGFIMYFVGTLSTFLLVAISFDRYYIINNQVKKRYNIPVEKKKSYYISITLACILLSFIWSSLPLVGWSYYSLQESTTSCCIEWRDQSINVLSYNIVTFGVVYLIPLLLIISLNLKLISMVKYLNKFVRDLNQESVVKKRLIYERNLTLRNTIVIVFFMISWSPFALVSMYITFIDPKASFPLISIIISTVTKSSFLWTSLIHIIFDNRIRKKLIKIINFNNRYMSN